MGSYVVGSLVGFGVGLLVCLHVIGLKVIVGLCVVGLAVIGTFVVGSFVLHDMEPQRHSAGNSEATF
jgi:hypothetical protein